MESKRQLSNAEVALLGLVCERPKHAWQIEKDVEHRDTRSWTDLSQSTIYKQLRALEAAGLVASAKEVVDGRLRKIYAPTLKGKKVLAARLLELLAEPEHLKWRIDLATYNMDLVEPDDAIAALGSYRAALDKRIEDYRRLEHYLVSSDCPTHRLAVARRPVRLLEGEIRWVDEFVAEMKEARG
jgi:DNA-binding PadR family transcriptional regulator